MTTDTNQYERAYTVALTMLKETELEIRSALKQAASDEGIPFGEPMGKFVHWAEKKLFGGE